MSHAHGLGDGRPVLGGYGLSFGKASPAMSACVFVNTVLSTRWAIPWRMSLPHAELPKLIWQPQKLVPRWNSSSKYSFTDRGLVTNNPGFVANWEINAGLRGQSVRSMHGDGVCRQMNSLFSSVKNGVVSVLNAGPEGYQFSVGAA